VAPGRCVTVLVGRHDPNPPSGRVLALGTPGKSPGCALARALRLGESCHARRPTQDLHVGYRPRSSMALSRPSRPRRLRPVGLEKFMFHLLFETSELHLQSV
jgi:hypothetical protein